MFIRKTATRNKSTSETYFTYRLVSSTRIGRQVRQITLLNLGRHFDLKQSHWPRLCARIDALRAGQVAMLAEPEGIEAAAQRYAARLIAARPALCAHIARCYGRRDLKGSDQPSFQQRELAKTTVVDLIEQPLFQFGKARR